MSARILALLAALLWAGATIADDKDRRSLPGWDAFRFGMTPREVSGAAHGTIFVFEGNLTYATTIDGRRFTATFYFGSEADSLQSILLRESADETQIEPTYEKDVALVTSKYGKPDKHDATSSSFLFRDGSVIGVDLVSEIGAVLIDYRRHELTEPKSNTSSF